MNFPRRTFLNLAVGATAGAAALSAVPRIARAQAYPLRPVRIVAGLARGGATGLPARSRGPGRPDRAGLTAAARSERPAAPLVCPRTRARLPPCRRRIR